MGRKKNHKKTESTGGDSNEVAAEVVDQEQNEAEIEVVPEPNEVETGVVPELNEVVPELNEVVPEPNEVETGVVPELNEVVPEPKEVETVSDELFDEMVYVDVEKPDVPSPVKLHDDIREVRKYIDEEEQLHRSGKMLMCTIQ